MSEFVNYDQSTEEVQQEFFNEIGDGYEKRKGSWLWDIVKAFASLFSSLTKKLTTVAQKLDVENLEGEELETFIMERTGIERKTATFGSGILTIFGNGTVPAGSFFETAGLVRFKTLKTLEVRDSGKVEIEAVNSGTVGNVIAGSITKIPITIQGITGCINEAETSGGYEEETDSDLLIRYYDKLRTPATSGNIYHYKQWAKEINGVGDAKVFPLWAGNNTVKVLIIDNDRKPASPELVATVQEYIDPNCSGTGEGQAPIGAYCTVESAKGYTVNISVKLTLEATASEEDVILGITEELENYFSSIAFSSTLLSFAIVGARILNVDGVLDYIDLYINGEDSNLTCGDDEVFILGGVVLS